LGKNVNENQLYNFHYSRMPVKSKYCSHQEYEDGKLYLDAVMSEKVCEVCQSPLSADYEEVITEAKNDLPTTPGNSNAIVYFNFLKGKSDSDEVIVTQKPKKRKSDRGEESQKKKTKKDPSISELLKEIADLNEKIKEQQTIGTNPGEQDSTFSTDLTVFRFLKTKYFAIMKEYMSLGKQIAKDTKDDKSSDEEKACKELYQKAISKAWAIMMKNEKYAKYENILERLFTEKLEADKQKGESKKKKK
jgi:hypothetical protein